MCIGHRSFMHKAAGKSGSPPVGVACLKILGLNDPLLNQRLGWATAICTQTG